MSCAPMRFLVGTGATVALAGLGYLMTGGYGDIAAPAPATATTAPVATPAPVETAAAPETAATVEQVASCQTQVDTAIKGKTIQFDTNAATIKAESQPLIDALAETLKPCAGTQIAVEGHTDLTGDPAANMTLSEARANAVVQALAAKGVPDARLAAKGFGETQPLQRGMGDAVNAANRRIEFSVTATGTAPAEAAPATGQ